MPAEAGQRYSLSMGERMSWEEYRRANDISDGAEGEAFAAYLHYLSGGTWDGEAREVKGPAKPG
ncbi:hypothetical protein QFZ29_003378 [Agromyces albus]|nr:hypothetical protein [Agromyces albus]